jgi:hypothetical protein
MERVVIVKGDSMEKIINLVWDELWAEHGRLPRTDGRLGPKEIERCANLERRFFDARLPELRAVLSSAARGDIDWLSASLLDARRKGFVGSVFRHGLEPPEELFDPMIEAAIAETDPTTTICLLSPAFERSALGA